MKAGDSDRISNLPNCLLIKILSLLNAKDVARTCILSKKWRNVWSFVPILDFELADNGEMEKFSNFVSSFLSLRDESTSVHTFTLTFSEGCYFEISDLVKTWIMYALNHKVKKLEVGLKGIRTLFLPNCQFNCDTVEDVHLSGFSVIVVDTVSLPKLRTLSLDNVAMHNDSMQKLLSGCPALTDMTMCNTEMYMNSISFQTVKSLTMQYCSFHARSDNSPSVIISAPCLQYFKFVEKWPSSVTFKDMSKLTNVFIARIKNLRRLEYNNLLSSLKGIQSLELFCIDLKVHGINITIATASINLKTIFVDCFFYKF